MRWWEWVWLGEEGRVRGRKTASYPRFVTTPCRALSGNQGQPHGCDCHLRWVCSVAKQPITSHHNCKQTVTRSMEYGVRVTWSTMEYCSGGFSTVTE